MKTREEEEMLELIVGTARQDPMIRAVLLEGSRALATPAKDPFQDYDVIYVVTYLEPYRNNLEWIKKFGELMVLQMPDAMGDRSPPDNAFTYLMQFTDGTRIDLNLCLTDHLKTERLSSQSVVLLDKDSAFDLPAPNDSDFIPNQPTHKQFFDCCNEFWWVAPYVAKGLWRNQLPYARHMLDNILRGEAIKMATWYFGIKTGFGVSPGKYGKHFRSHLEPHLYDLFLKSFEASDVTTTWIATEKLCSFFRTTAQTVAKHFRYEYPAGEDRNVSDFLKHIRNLPSDAKAIY